MLRSGSDYASLAYPYTEHSRTEPPVPFLSPQQVSDLVPGLTVGALAQLRYTGRGPRYRKPTPRTVLYDEQEVLAWIESSARTSTAEVA